MDYLKLAWEYRYIVIAALFGAGYVWQNRSHLKETWMAELKQFALEKMFEIEKQVKDGIEIHGQEKMEWVITKIMTEFVPNVPDWFKPFCTEQNVRMLAQFVYDKALDFIDDGVLNRSVSITL